MVITPLIKDNLKSVGYLQGTYEARSILRSEGIAFVMENGHCLGILTLADLGMRSHLLVADCLTDKPAVNFNAAISDVLTTMIEAGCEALPVVRRDSIIGAVVKNDILQFLSTSYAEKDSLFYSMVHDLRAPIGNLASLVELLQPKLSKNEDDANTLTMLQRLCTNALGLLEESSSYLRTGVQREIQKKKVDLNQFLQECLQTLEPGIQKAEQRLIFKASDKPIFIMLYTQQFPRVVENLIINATKFTPDGGMIEVQTSVIEQSVCIVFSDTGIGIPEHLHQFIFDKLTDAKRTGLRGEPTIGFGLYIVKKIVQDHGGQISFESVEGKGSVFKIILPLG